MTGMPGGGGGTPGIPTGKGGMPGGGGGTKECLKGGGNITGAGPSDSGGRAGAA